MVYVIRVGSAASAACWGWVGRLWLLGLLLGLVGCVQPELGDIPFKCNNGTPACPEGYRCVQQGLEELCVREGYRFPDASVRVDAALVEDTGVLPPGDSQAPAPDRVLTPDRQLPRWDLGPIDAFLDGPPKKDSGEPMLLCQSSADCKTSGEPCCCPLPLVPFIQVCLSFCLDPFCF